MSAIVILAFGSLCLSLCVGYWLWMPIRRYRLMIDILEQVVCLDETAERLDAKGDAAYLRTRRGLCAFSKHTDILSWTTIAFFTVMEVPGSEAPHTGNVELAREIDRIKTFIGARVADYLMYDTASGIALRSMIFILPKKETIEKMQSVVGRVIEPINDSYGSRGHAARC